MGEYVYSERVPVFGGMDSQDIVALGELGMLHGQDQQDYLTMKGMDRQDYLTMKGMDRQDYQVAMGRLPSPLPNPAFVGLGQTGGDVATMATVGIGVMLVSAAVSFGLMVGASYLGARWAGCRRAA